MIRQSAAADRQPKPSGDFFSPSTFHFSLSFFLSLFLSLSLSLFRSHIPPPDFFFPVIFPIFIFWFSCWPSALAFSLSINPFRRRPPFPLSSFSTSPRPPIMDVRAGFVTSAPGSDFHSFSSKKKQKRTESVFGDSHSNCWQQQVFPWFFFSSSFFILF